jgi:hypothetical protein
MSRKRARAAKVRGGMNIYGKVDGQRKGKSKMKVLKNRRYGKVYKLNKQEEKS